MIAVVPMDDEGNFQTTEDYWGREGLGQAVCPHDHVLAGLINRFDQPESQVLPGVVTGAMGELWMDQEKGTTQFNLQTPAASKHRRRWRT